MNRGASSLKTMRWTFETWIYSVLVQVLLVGIIILVEAVMEWGSMSVQVERRLFNVDEYYRLAEVGILHEHDRVELIEGEILRMSPIGSRHTSSVKRLNKVLSPKLDGLATLGVQDPIRLDEYSEPQPDISVLKLRDDLYSERHPMPEDVLLLIEVSDSSLDYDRNVKVPLYARAGIPEVWLAILAQDHVEAYSSPVNGSYQDVRIVRRGESLSPEMLPSVVVSAEEILK